MAVLLDSGTCLPRTSSNPSSSAGKTPGLFENTTALPLTTGQLAMLVDAAASDWSDVEPSIFGTLLVRALDPRERHKLGAEFTPRSYVERLNRPTIIEPLRDEWQAVRIAMTVAAPGKGDGILEKVTDERPMEHGENEVSLVKVVGVIAPNLQIGADLTSCSALIANSKLSCPGVKLHGSGFIVSNEEANQLYYGTIENLDNHLKGYRNGKDLTNRPRDVRVIVLFGLSEEEARTQYPTL